MSIAHKKILIVEDEKPLAHALELKLQKQGCIVTTAHDGQEGVKLLDSDSYDVLLLDLMMPVVDGFQVLEHLQNKASKPIVFVLSNLAQGEDEARTMQLGASKFFIKSNTPLSVIVEEIGKL